jgi:hypothetical protein
VGTKRDGLVFTFTGGPKYYAAGTNASGGPAYMHSSAESASELEGLDVSVGASSAWGVAGGSVEQSRSLNDPRIWTNTYGYEGGYGSAVYVGPNYTTVFDVPGL